MITLENDQLVFRFADVHEDAWCTIQFQRTLRIPDDDKDYPLPPGLGYFPLRHLDDYARRIPEAWLNRGGVILPMYQAEAMWLYFSGNGYPFAVKVATGKICAVTGDEWRSQLNRDPQDYMVIPNQPWLDGYCVEDGVIRADHRRRRAWRGADHRLPDEGRTLRGVAPRKRATPQSQKRATHR